MNIVYTALTGEVLAEVLGKDLGPTLERLIQEGHNEDDLRVHVPSPIDMLSEWRR